MNLLIFISHLIFIHYDFLLILFKSLVIGDPNSYRKRKKILQLDNPQRID